MKFQVKAVEETVIRNNEIKMKVEDREEEGDRNNIYYHDY